MQIIRISVAGLSILSLAGCADMWSGTRTNPSSILSDTIKSDKPSVSTGSNKVLQGMVQNLPAESSGLISPVEKKRESLRKVLDEITNRHDDYISSLARTRRSEDLISLPIIGAAVGAGIALMNGAPASTIGGFGIAGGALSYTQSYFNLDSRTESTLRALFGLNCLGQQAIPLLAADAVFLNTAKQKLDTQIEAASGAALLSGLGDRTSKELNDRLSVARLTARAVNAELELYFTSDFFLSNAIDNIEIYVQSARRREAVNFEEAFTAIQAARDKVAVVEAVKASPSGTKDTSADGAPKAKAGDGTLQELDRNQISDLVQKLKAIDTQKSQGLTVLDAVLNGKPATNLKNDERAKQEINALNQAIEQAKLSIPTPSIATSHEQMVKCSAFASAK